MKMALLFIGVLILFILSFGVYRLFAFKSESRAYSKEQLGPLLPLAEKLEANEEISKSIIQEFAKSPSTRWSLYSLLSNFGKENLFPFEYNTYEKAAESNLISWLKYPTELEKEPDEIHFLKKVAVNGFNYYVYKFRTNKPHWAAKNGWMLGVAGAYTSTDTPFQPSSSSFSRLSKVDSVNIEDEVQWVHENITSRK